MIIRRSPSSSTDIGYDYVPDDNPIRPSCLDLQDRAIACDVGCGAGQTALCSCPAELDLGPIQGPMGVGGKPVDHDSGGQPLGAGGCGDGAETQDSTHAVLPPLRAKGTCTGLSRRVTASPGIRPAGATGKARTGNLHQDGPRDHRRLGNGTRARFAPWAGCGRRPDRSGMAAFGRASSVSQHSGTALGGNRRTVVGGHETEDAL